MRNKDGLKYRGNSACSWANDLFGSLFTKISKNTQCLVEKVFCQWLWLITCHKGHALAISLEEYLHHSKTWVILERMRTSLVSLQTARWCPVIWDYSKYYGKGSHQCFLLCLPVSFSAMVSLAPLQSVLTHASFQKRPMQSFRRLYA